MIKELIKIISFIITIIFAGLLVGGRTGPFDLDYFIPFLVVSGVAIG